MRLRAGKPLKSCLSALVLVASTIAWTFPARAEAARPAKPGASRVKAAPAAARVRVVVAAGSARHHAHGVRGAHGDVGVRRAVLIRGGHGVRLHKVYATIPARPSLASLQGLRGTSESIVGDIEDNLSVKSSVALVMEEGTHDVLFSRNTKIALPIASITKLMTALVVLDSHPSMDELITVSADDLDTEKFSRSRLAIGTTLSRRDLMHLALMASENRAAHALARNYPGGLDAAIVAMNVKARALGMTSAAFHDPTGLTSRNVASAEDLVKLVNAASNNPVIREFSTDPEYSVPVGRRTLAFHNTNALVVNPAWDIIVQKTGYISEAGKCLVMKAVIEGRSVVIVLLDSFGKFTRLGDANRIRQWMENQAPSTDPIARLVKKTS